MGHYLAGSFLISAEPVAALDSSLSSSSNLGAESRSAMAEGGGLSMGCFLIGSHADNVSVAREIARSEKYFIIQSSCDSSYDFSITESISLYLSMVGPKKMPSRRTAFYKACSLILLLGWFCGSRLLLLSGSGFSF